jgi:hypothetical protein
MNKDYFSKKKMMYSSNPVKEAEKEVSTLTNKAGSFLNEAAKLLIRSSRPTVIG